MKRLNHIGTSHKIFGRERSRDVKIHIFECHWRLHCQRCYVELDPDEMAIHVKQQNACAVLSVAPDDLRSISHEQYEQLKLKKQIRVTEVERWRIYYRILFPTTEEDEIPDPHFSLNNDTLDLMHNYTDHLLKELPHCMLSKVDSQIGIIENTLRALQATQNTENTSSAMMSLAQNLRSAIPPAVKDAVIDTYRSYAARQLEPRDSLNQEHDGTHAAESTMKGPKRPESEMTAFKKRRNPEDSPTSSRASSPTLVSDPDSTECLRMPKEGFRSFNNLEREGYPAQEQKAPLVEDTSCQSTDYNFEDIPKFDLPELACVDFDLSTSVANEDYFGDENVFQFDEQTDMHGYDESTAQIGTRASTAFNSVEHEGLDDHLLESAILNYFDIAAYTKTLPTSDEGLHHTLDEVPWPARS